MQIRLPFLYDTNKINANWPFRDQCVMLTWNDGDNDVLGTGGQREGQC